MLLLFGRSQRGCRRKKSQEEVAVGETQHRYFATLIAETFSVTNETDLVSCCDIQAGSLIYTRVSRRVKNTMSTQPQQDVHSRIRASKDTRDTALDALLCLNQTRSFISSSSSTNSIVLRYLQPSSSFLLSHSLSLDRVLRASLLSSARIASFVHMNEQCLLITGLIN